MELGADDARGSLGWRQRRGVLAGRKAGGVGINGQDHQALGLGYRSFAGNTRGSLVLCERRGLLAGWHVGGIGVVG